MSGVPVLINLGAAGALFAIGLYCLIARSNLLKMVIGLELLGKGTSLLFVLGGYLAGDVGTSQAVVFTLIVVEAVVAAVALALVVLVKKAYLTLDVAALAAKARRGEE